MTAAISAAGQLRRGLILGLLVLLTAGCGGRTQWQLMNVSGLVAPLAFELTDAGTGQPVDAAAFEGKVVLLYFGYTHCPDVCPTTLAELTGALRKLQPAQADRVRILFVTVDPRRDTLPILRRYAKAFGPNVVGLRGSQDELTAVTRRYRVSYGYGKPGPDGGYEVSHSSAVYVFDGRGEARLLGKPGSTQAAYVHDLTALLAASR